MKEMMKKILENIKGQVTFADIRVTKTDTESYMIQRGSLKNISADYNDTNAGIRVLVNGCWGFAGTDRLTTAALETAAKRAIANAKHGARFRHTPVTFPAVKPTVAEHFAKPVEDPFLMSKEDKTGYLLEIGEKLTKNEKIVYSHVYAEFYRQHKIYMNTEGTSSETMIYQTMPEMYVLASGNGETQSRTYPGHMTGRNGGFEVVRDYKFHDHVDEIISEAIALLDAPRIEEERADLIITGGHLALQIHESVGHATEADRIFGMEISYAGKTFISPDMIGKHQYGSPVVNIISDSSDPDGMGYHPVDDEGIPGRRVDIIKDGILVNQQTSREVAHQLGLEPSSNMKATHGYNVPLIRMTNFSLLPGNAGTLQDLIKDTEHGYLVDYTKTWSIDDNRNNFQFTTEIGWKIENGEITGIVKEPTYFGITTEFWNACDAVCDEREWAYHGTFHCGKGEPGQAMHLSHKVAPARFKDIVVNVKA